MTNEEQTWEDVRKMDLILVRGLTDSIDEGYKSHGQPWQAADYRGFRDWRLFAVPFNEPTRDTKAEFNAIALYELGIATSDEAWLKIGREYYDKEKIGIYPNKKIFIHTPKDKSRKFGGLGTYNLEKLTPLERGATSFNYYDWCQLLNGRHKHKVFGMYVNPFPMDDYNGELLNCHNSSDPTLKGINILKETSEMYRGNKIPEVLANEGLEEYVGFIKDFREKYSGEK